MVVTHTFVADMSRPSYSNTLLVSQNDANSRICKFVLMDNGYKFDMTDVQNAMVTYRTPSGSTVQTDAEIVKDEDGNAENVITCVIPSAVTYETGQSVAAVTLRNEDRDIQITSFEFVINTRNELLNFDGLSNAVDIASVRTLVQQALEALDKVQSMVGDSDTKSLPNPKPLYVNCGESADGTPVKQWTYIGSEDKTVVVGDVFYDKDRKKVDLIDWKETE